MGVRNGMALVVGVHGIAQQYEAGETLRSRWGPALAGGVAVAGGTFDPDDLDMAFYGDLFRPAGRTLAATAEPLRPDDLDELERELLALWWAEAARTDPAVSGPDDRTLGGRTPAVAQHALRALSSSRFFAGLTLRAMLGSLRQVRLYLDADGDVRAAAQARVAARITADTRIVVGHSLGSVVAYETLCALPDSPVRTLITLGSPLGIANVVFAQLRPRTDTAATPPGHWPAGVRSWTNVADAGDVVALVRDLRPLFGPDVRCLLVHNGAQAHAIEPYLTSHEVGTAVCHGRDGAPA